MDPEITLITLTGHRQEAFDRCVYYMGNQTAKYNIEWLVIDDDASTEMPSQKKLPNNLELHHFKGPMGWSPGINTQRPNMDLAIKNVEGKYILFIEDDDWYSPKYIEGMIRLLEMFLIVGEANSKYYNVLMPGYKEMLNTEHSSLCQTGIRRELLPFFHSCVHSGELYFDIQLWNRAKEEKIKRCLMSDVNLCVGMKSLPGRAGIGIGHKQKDYLFDAGHKQLTEWIGGSDASYYRQFAKERKQYTSPSAPSRIIQP